MTLRFWIAWLPIVLAGCAEPHVPLPDGADELDRNIVLALEDAAVPGAQVALVRNGDVALARAYGYADTRTERLNDNHTRFMAASVSKLVTGVAVLQLAQEGRLDLDADLSAILPMELEHPEHPAIPLTARQLLGHATSVRDNWDVLGALYTPHDPVVDLETFVRGYFLEGGEYHHARKNWRSATPGSVFEYSNVGFTLLGYVVEVVDGRSFDQYCQEEIFAPTGMSETTWFFDALTKDELAVPTEWARGFIPLDHYGFVDYPSGSLRTTATDLGRFALALLEPDQLLPEAAIAEAWQIAFPDLEPSQGLAFAWWKLDAVDVVGHDGGENGVSAELVLRPSRGDAAVVLLNGDASAKDLAQLERLLFESR